MDYLSFDIINKIKELAPCYIYDEIKIVSACQKLKSLSDKFVFLYSVKSNPFQPVINTIAKQDFGMDVASVNEIYKSLDANVNKDKIYYSAPGKTIKDIEDSIDKAIVIADSINEILLIEKIAKHRKEIVDIGIRVNPLFTMGGEDRFPNKFGIDLEQIKELETLVKRCENINVVGVHIHLKSQILDEETICKYYMDVLDTAIEIEKILNTRIEFVNFGSGIGIAYDKNKEIDLDFEKMKIGISRLVEKNNRTIKAKLLIETGRFVVCQSGHYYTKIVDIKESMGKKYVIVQNGLNGFMRPAISNLVKTISDNSKVKAMEPLYTNDNEFEIRVINDNNEKEIVDVVGNLCTSMDVIKGNVLINKSQLGDIICISNAGSYSYSLSPLIFSSHELPKEFLLSLEGEFKE